MAVFWRKLVQKMRGATSDPKIWSLEIETNLGGGWWLSKKLSCSGSVASEQQLGETRRPLIKNKIEKSTKEDDILCGLGALADRAVVW
jgi:hypothetical protein